MTTDVAVRHDSFSAFADATTRPCRRRCPAGADWRLIAGYGEGIAQPTFYDLYGFFPGSFIGNPALGPERSKGWDAGVRWRERRRLSLGAQPVQRQPRRTRSSTSSIPRPSARPPPTPTGTSRRRGIEAEAELAAWRKAASSSFNYTWLDAEERQVAGGLQLREVRRPRHSFNLVGNGAAGRFSWGATLAYVGKRGDTDFDVFPARAVMLDDYRAGLAAARLAGLAGRSKPMSRAENAFDADYQDVFGYGTPGRTVYAGIRLRLGD